MDECPLPAPIKKYYFCLRDPETGLPIGKTLVVSEAMYKKIMELMRNV